MTDSRSHAPAPESTPPDTSFRRTTLTTIAWLIALASTAMVPVLMLAEREHQHVVSAAAYSLFNWVMVWLLGRGKLVVVPYMMVAAATVVATVAVLASGTVRSAGSYLFLGAVAGAGVMLGRRALIATVLTSVSVLGGLNLAESHGMLRSSLSQVGISVWLVQTTIIALVASLVFYSREREMAATRKQLEELEQRRQSERDRDRSADRFVRIFRLSPNPMVAQSATDASIVAVNPAFERVYGYTQSEVEGRNEAFLWDDQAQRAQYLDMLRRERRVVQYPCMARRADGSTFSVLASSELGDSHQDALVITSVTDRSEEKRRESLLVGIAQGMTGDDPKAFFASLTQHMAHTLKADLVFVGEVVPQQNVRTLSVWRGQAHQNNFTYRTAGLPCEQVLHQHELCVCTQATQVPSATVDTVNASNAALYVGQALLGPDGAPVGLLTAMWAHDVPLTDELRALISIFASRASAELLRLHRDREVHMLNETLEQRVRVRTAELNKLNAELDSFAYSVSHDLKSPLRAIDGFTRLISEQFEGRMSAEEAAMLNRVIGATTRMSQLIADMLSLARISQGNLQRRWVNLSALAEGIRNSTQERTPERSIDWHIEPDLFSWCDPQLMTIALENLLLNSVKYTRDQPHARISFGRAESLPSGDPRWCVRDNGAGFDMAYADKLFKPFQRLHMPSSGFEGTGIGLATVRRIVERHGGDISGEAAIGQGASFVFSLGKQDANPAATVGATVPTAQTNGG